MDWWQLVLIFLASIPVGIAIGSLITYLYLRFIEKRQIALLTPLTLLFTKKRETLTVVKEQPVKEQPKFTPPGLLTEVKHNLKIAGEPAEDGLSSFQTDVWDAQRYRVGDLPANLRDDLEQAYVDMHLANNLVWLSTEFGRRTPDLNENYMRLCASIAQRLDKIKQIIGPGLPNE